MSTESDLNRVSKSASMHTNQVDTSRKNVPGSSGQMQKPVERRRLQNRLSQRNHRRKIRDRIAKLQERVIASELKAAAGVNSWDQYQSYTAPGHIPVYERLPTPRSETPASSNHGYTPTNGRSASNTALGQMSLLSPEPSPSLFDRAEFDSSASSSSFLNTSPCPPTLGPDAPLYFPGQGIRTYPGTAINPPPPIQHEPLNIQPQSPSSHSYCIATETTLPQILQSLNTSPSGTRAIILIPQNSSHPQSPLISNSVPRAPPTPASNPAETTPLRSANIPNTRLCQGQRHDRGLVPVTIPNSAGAGGNGNTTVPLRGGLGRSMDWFVPCIGSGRVGIRV